MPGSVNDSPLHHADHSHVQQVYLPPVLEFPVKVKIGPEDTIESIQDKSSQKKVGKGAESPDLAEAQRILWGGAPVPFNLHEAGKSGKAGAKVDSVGAVSSNSELVFLKQQNALLKIALKVVDAWSKSLEEEAKAIRRILHSDRYRELQAEHGRAGFEAFLETLTPEQREHTIHFSRLERLAKIDEGIAQGLGDYLTHIKANKLADPAYMMGIISVGAPVRFDFASGSQVVGQQVVVNPVGEVSHQVLPRAMPSYSVEMGTVATMFGIGTVYTSMGQTVASGVVPTDNSFTNKFAKNYAQQILKTINGSEFNTLALAIVTAHAARGEPLSKQRADELISAIRVVMLSSALILLYKTESAFLGQGGGMTEIEFDAFVKGTMDKKDLAADLGAQIRTLLGAMDKAESKALYMGILSYVASKPKTATLIDIDAVFSGVGAEIAPPDLPA